MILAGLFVFPTLHEEAESLRKYVGMAGIKFGFDVEDVLAIIAVPVVTHDGDCSWLFVSLPPLDWVYANTIGTDEFGNVIGKLDGNFKSVWLKKHLKFLAEQYNWHDGKISLWRRFMWLKKFPVDFVVPEMVPKQVVQVACMPPGVFGWGCML